MREPKALDCLSALVLLRQAQAFCSWREYQTKQREGEGLQRDTSYPSGLFNKRSEWFEFWGGMGLYEAKKAGPWNENVAKLICSGCQADKPVGLHDRKLQSGSKGEMGRIRPVVLRWTCCPGISLQWATTALHLLIQKPGFWSGNQNCLDLFCHSVLPDEHNSTANSLLSFSRWFFFFASVNELFSLSPAHLDGQ